MARAALGIRPHSGWAIVVAVTAPPAVELVLRRRIEIVAPGDPRQCWHVAQDRGLSPEEAADLERRVTAGADAAAADALAAVVADVEAAGHRLVAAGIVGEPRDLPAAEKILVNHALLHSAEGEPPWQADHRLAAAVALDALELDGR